MRTRAGAQQESGTADCGTVIIGEAQGDRVPTANRAAGLSRSSGQVVIPAESRADVSAHGFWKRGTTAMCDIRIVNLDAGS